MKLCYDVLLLIARLLADRVHVLVHARVKLRYVSDVISFVAEGFVCPQPL